MRQAQYLILVIAVLGCVFSVCTDAKKGEKKPFGSSAQHDDHGHDHHDHVHGPKGGEIVKVADAGMVVECVAKYGQNLVIFYLYNEDGKTPHKIKAEKIVGTFKKGEVQTVDIPAVDTGDAGESSRFEIENEDFALARKTTGVKIEFEADGKKHTVDVPKDPHG